jgi:hypothetical protein
MAASPFLNPSVTQSQPNTGAAPQAPAWGNFGGANRWPGAMPNGNMTGGPSLQPLGVGFSGRPAGMIYGGLMPMTGTMVTPPAGTAAPAPTFTNGPTAGSAGTQFSHASPSAPMTTPRPPNPGQTPGQQTLGGFLRGGMM